MLDMGLREHPVLRELYTYKEALHRFYRMRGGKRAARVLTAMTDTMAASKVPEILTLRWTLMKWRDAILAYSTWGLQIGLWKKKSRPAKGG